MDTKHPMELALLDALVLSLDNEKDAEEVLRIALPHFIRFYDRDLENAHRLLTYWE